MNRIDLTPTELFVEFLTKMKRWDNFCNHIKSQPLSHAVSVKQRYEALKEIYDYYLTSKERKLGKLSSLSVTTPAEYDPETISIESCEADQKKALIVVQEMLGFKRRIRYTLLKKQDGWRIDKREVYDAFTDKWVNRVM